jgi:pimeloyl-ACP methyl ester carboxylesterase
VRGEQSVVWLAGAGAPPDQTFGGCIDMIGRRVRHLPKPLELFESEQPPDGYSFETEIGGILRVMDNSGMERAHLVGYSGGGGIAMAFTIEHPERVLSLAVDEHVVGHRLGVDDEDQFWADIESALQQEGLNATLAVVAATNAPDAAPPEFGDPAPPWLLSRIAGTPVLVRAARDYVVSRDDLARIQCPVYAAYGSETRTAFKGWCEEVAAAVARGAAECYEGCDHFRQAHEVDPARFAEALLAHWELSQR